MTKPNAPMSLYEALILPGQQIRDQMQPVAVQSTPHLAGIRRETRDTEN